MQVAGLRDSIVRKYKKAVDNARLALANDIVIYYKTGNKITVTSAEWDPINNEMIDINSVSDNPLRDEILTKTVKATTSRLGISDKYQPIQTAGGKIDRNEVIISCKLSDVLLDPTQVSGETLFHRAVKIDVNGDFCIPKTTPLKYGIAGDLYGCAVTATFDTTL
jgi:hypothetical protein